jgi:sialic acid synthase SpsE
MASLKEIEAAISVYPSPESTVTLLHAVSKYPTPLPEANLHRMVRLRLEFGLDVGYSDHTSGCVSAATAVALGATAIEKHFTLDKSWPGPDHLASADPDDFRQMVDAIDQVSLCLGTGEFALQPEEEDMSLVSRKSLHLREAVSAGTAIQEQHLMLRRPGTGLMWRDRGQVLGKVSSRDLAAGEIIQIADFE